MKLSTILENDRPAADSPPEGLTPQQHAASPTIDVRIKNDILTALVVKMTKQYTADNHKMAADTEAMLARHRGPVTRPEARVPPQ
jgi:hypothetical protein